MPTEFPTASVAAREIHAAVSHEAPPLRHAPAAAHPLAKSDTIAETSSSAESFERRFNGTAHAVEAAIPTESLMVHVSRRRQAALYLFNELQAIAKPHVAAAFLQSAFAERADTLLAAGRIDAGDRRVLQELVADRAWASAEEHDAESSRLREKAVYFGKAGLGGAAIALVSAPVSGVFLHTASTMHWTSGLGTSYTAGGVILGASATSGAAVMVAGGRTALNNWSASRSAADNARPMRRISDALRAPVTEV